MHTLSLACFVSGLDIANVQCMARCESLHEAKNVYIHSAQDADVEELMRAAPDIKFTRSEAFGNPELQELVR